MNDDHVIEVLERVKRLVGVPYRVGGRSVEDGFDCVTLVAAVYAIIGDVTGDVEAWRFPFPPTYDAVEGSITVESLERWAESFEECEAQFGAIVNLRGTHVGVLVGPHYESVIHTRSSTGVVVQRLRALRPLVRDFWKLKRCG